MFTNNIFASNEKVRKSGAIVGGAVIPPAYGFLIDKTALLLLIACYGYVLFFGLFRSPSGQKK